MRRALFLSGLTALACLAGALFPAASPAAYEVPAEPPKGAPYAGAQATVPYEDVLDHCELLLVGKVSKLADGRIELAVSGVLRGELKDKTAAMAFGGTWEDASVAKAPAVGEEGAFFVLRDRQGQLRLAGDPPKGGGFIEEGPALADKLLEAARDPRKGYASKDGAVRLSSAYRLARAWLAAPEDQKPELPADLVETLIGGLDPEALRGRHVNAAARNALNLLLDCDINTLARYSVNSSEADRKDRAGTVREIWERTALNLEERRGKVRVAQPEADAAEAAKLVQQLGAEDFDRREAAQKALAKLGKRALAQIEAGVKSKDAEIATRCEQLLATLKGAPPGGSPAPETATFPLERAEPLVPRAKPAPEKGPAPAGK